MLKDAIVVGQQYAYREKRTPGTPMLKVTLLDKVTGRSKVRVRFEDGPYPGLEDYADGKQIVCPWPDRLPILRDEKKMAELVKWAAPGRDKVLAEAATVVLSSTGEDNTVTAHEGVSDFFEDELQRILDRAHIDTPPEELHLLGFRDRHGTIHLPLDTVLMIVRAFAAAEPQAVVDYIDEYEEEYRVKAARDPRDWYSRSIMRSYAPAHALARQWAGFEQEAEMLRAEIGRLRKLLADAEFDLRQLGQERKAQKLMRAVDRP